MEQMSKVVAVVVVVCLFVCLIIDPTSLTQIISRPVFLKETEH